MESDTKPGTVKRARLLIRPRFLAIKKWSPVAADSEIQLQKYVDLAQANQRPSLIQRLLEIDLEHRLNSGEQLNRADYERRYPDCVESVREAFSAVQRRSKAMGHDEVSTPSSPQTEQVAETIGIRDQPETVAADHSQTVRLDRTVDSSSETANDSVHRKAPKRDFGEYAVKARAGVRPCVRFSQVM